MIDILHKWNRWGTSALPSGIKRLITERIIPYIHTPEVIVLVGPRRSGKSTILYQLMDALEAEGISKQAMLHVNFEEPKLISSLNLNGLDDLYDSYREHVFPEGKAFLFLDEIQNVPQWERWIRARSQTEDVKIFITGSSAKLMSREIATLLTGRHLSFEVSPLNFAEYLTFKNIPLPRHRLPVTAPPIIRQALNDYQQWGGFPAVTLAETVEYKQNLLSTYFDDILYKDIVLRHSIRDSILLRNVAVHLLTQTGNLLSFQRIATIFQISTDTATHYCHCLQESFMTELLPFFSLKAAIRQRHPQKVYALDLGLRGVVSLAHSPDNGRLSESLIYQSLRRRFGDNLFYWKGKQEIDFVVREGNTIAQIWQVVADKLDDPEVAKREVGAIEEAKKNFPHAASFIVAKSLPKDLSVFSSTIIPLWQLLLEEE